MSGIGTLPRPASLARLRPGAKLLGLFIFGVAIIVTPGWVPAVVAVAISLVVAAMSGLPARRLGRVLLGFAPVAAILFAFQWWRNGWETGLEVVAGLIALIVAASAVTASTAVSDMLDTVAWALGPLRRVGVSPERVALAFALAIRSLPLAIDVARETRQAARARGLDRSLRAFAVPFAVRMVAHARDVGAALHARGLGDE